MTGFLLGLLTGGNLVYAGAYAKRLSNEGKPGRAAVVIITSATLAFVAGFIAARFT